MTTRKEYRAAAVAGGLLLVYLSFYCVRETEFALVTQFGRPVRTVLEAGLHVKWPFQYLLRFDRRLRIYNPRPSEFLTRDKKNLVIENYVAWRIEDPNRFVQSVGDASAAEMRLHDIIWSGLSAALGASHLAAARVYAKLTYAVGILVNGASTGEAREGFAAKIATLMSIEEPLAESRRSPAPRREITGAMRRDPTPRGR